MFKKKPVKKIVITKFLDDLPGMEDVVHNPRHFSQKTLTDACNNIKFSPSEEIDPIENLTIQFIFRNLIYIMHQTGLYNQQRRLFNQIATIERVEIKEFTKLSKEDIEKGKITDLYFYDIHERFVLLRLEHPNSDFNFAALPNAFAEANNKRCLGVIYVSNKLPSSPVMDMIKAKTSFDNPMERYAAPINDHASFNLVHYQASADAVTYKLLHPDLGKDESVTAKVSADLIAAFYAGDTSLV